MLVAVTLDGSNEERADHKGLDMEFLTQLWLPILVSGVLVFIASSVIWMATPLHKADYSDPPDEDGVMEVLRRASFGPGMYYIPWCRNFKDASNDPVFKEKMAKGPWALLIVAGGPPNFARSLIQWFINCLIISALVAYVGSAAIPMGVGAPDYLKVFRVIGAVALLSHAGMAAHDTMWKGLSWRSTAVKIFDGLLYSLLMAGVFGWLWPRGDLPG